MRRGTFSLSLPSFLLDRAIYPEAVGLGVAQRVRGGRRARVCRRVRGGPRDRVRRRRPA